MKLGSPRLWISLLSATGVAYLGLGDLGRSSPGPLAAVHAGDSKLTGFGSCSQCHGGWTATMAESCLECHADIASQLEDNSGLHGTFKDGLAQQCSRCHSDHNGDGFQMVNKRSFAVAGLGEIQEFDGSLMNLGFNFLIIGALFSALGWIGSRHGASFSRSGFCSDRISFDW